MKLRYYTKAVFLIKILAMIGFGLPVIAEEKIIQEEKMSFEKCLEVISNSGDKYYISKLSQIEDLVCSFLAWCGTQDEMTEKEVYEFGAFDLDGNICGDGHELVQAAMETQFLIEALESEIR